MAYIVSLIRNPKGKIYYQEKFCFEEQVSFFLLGKIP